MKRALSVFLSLLLAFSCVAGAAAATFADSATHWALPAIEYMVSKKILNGYEDGTFRPERTVTRAEFIKMLDETFGLTAQTSISYGDVKESDWFYSYVAKAAAQGYLLNYGSSLNPTGTLSRQEAAALLTRYLDLDASKKAPSSTYADYTTIKTAYRDYVLQATAAGLFNGIREDDGSYTFRPDKLLTRAETLTILSRAAGTIYKGSQTGVDAEAAAGNAVVTQSGVTIQNASLSGRVLVSEGASGGVITFSGCNLGTLILRGTASVVLSDCTVENLLVDASVSGFTAAVSLTSNSQIRTAELRTPAIVSLAARTSVSSLTVGTDAKNSGVTGSGSLDSVKINASGFTSDPMPTRYELASGLSATLAGKTLSGASADGTQSGFTSQPSTYASAANCYLTATAVSAGTVYYYFTTSSAVPTTGTFTSYYSAAAVHASYAAVANIPRDTNLGATASVGAYPYVALMLVDSANNRYQPLVIENKASNGFTVAPSVSTTGQYQYISATPAVSGTLYYLYTSSSSMTLSSFSSAYSAASSDVKGTLTAAAGQSATSLTKRAADVSGYAYLAVLLENAAGEQYQPVVIPLSGSGAPAATTGFTSDPVSTSNANGISLSFTPSVSGTVEYYFSASGVVPTSAQFDANLTMTSASYTGSRTVERARPYTALIASAAEARSYPYVVVRLTSGSTKYQPVVVKLAEAAQIDLTGSGFTSQPTLTVSNGYYYITLPTSGSATVYYYLTNATSVANSTVFMTNYNSAISPYQATKTGGSLTAGYAATPLQTILPSSMYGSYTGLALMVTNGMQSGTPIVIPLTGSSSDSTPTDTGFLTGPIYNIYYTGLHQIEFMTNASGKVFYYYTDSSEVTREEVQSAMAQILFGSLSSSDTAGCVDVVARTQTSIPVRASVYPPYVVMFFVDASNTPSQHVVISTDGSSSSSISTGFSGTPSCTMQSGTPRLTYNTATSGKIYYYFTNTRTAPNDASSFLKAWIDASSSSSVPGFPSSSTGVASGSFDVGVGMGVKDISMPYGSYQYIALMFQSASGGTGGYYRPVTISTSGSSSSGGSGSIGSQTAFVTTPTLSALPWGGAATLTFTPAMSGTLFYSFTNENTMSAWLDPVKAYIGLGGTGIGSGSSLLQNPQQLSTLIAQLGRGGTLQAVTASYASQTASVTLNTSYKYLAVWIAGTTSMSSPVFLPVSGTTTGGSTGGGSYPWLSGGNGFSVTPTYNRLTSALDYTVDSTLGMYLVECVFTNTVTSTSMTSAQFDTLKATTSSDAQNVAFGGTSISVPASSYYPLYKYAWLRVVSLSGTGTDYTPVCVQLY